MLTWLRRREINRLLVTRAGLLAYVKYWKDAKGSAGLETRDLARINERLRQLGYKEQDNG